jgi:hypothetical protein
MRLLRSLSAGIAVLALASSSAADFAVPGLSLDREDLADLDIKCDDFIDCGSDLRALRLGAPAQVKGAKEPNASVAPVSDILGRFKGVVAPGNLFPSPIGGPYSSVSFSGGPGTLIPPMASGFIRHITNVPSVYVGVYVQALLYEPDQVKRKETSKESRALLKQKSHVGFRWGTTSNGLPGKTSFDTIKKCKAQAEIRQKKADLGKTYKMKVRCSGNDPDVAAIKARVADILGKKASGFDLHGSVDAPTPP